MKATVGCLLILATMANANCGKTTYSGSQSLVGLAFNQKYLPVYLPSDSCTDNTCDCTVDDVDYVVEQGRCQLNYTDMDTSTVGDDAPAPPAEGFGLHLVNCSTNGQPGGMTTAEVEAEFATKFGDMSSYDSFMDYNVALLTSDLDSYVTAFDVDNVTYLPIAFTDQDEAYCGVLVLVPESQMVIEVVQLNSSTTTKIASHPKLVTMNEQRHPHNSLKRATSSITKKLAARKPTSTGDIMVPVTIGRAASDLDAIATFYIDGMLATETLSYDDDSVSKRCYLWEDQEDTADVCFTKRSDDATSTDFKVSDFENMLISVHEAVIAGKDTNYYGCNNKWLDNHFYYTSGSSGYDAISDYIDTTEGVFVYCDSTGSHYISDPTGWGIQMDMQFTTSLCDSRRRLRRQQAKKKALNNGGDVTFDDDMRPPPPDDDQFTPPGPDDDQFIPPDDDKGPGPSDDMGPPGMDDMGPPGMDDDKGPGPDGFCPCTGMIMCGASGGY